MSTTEAARLPGSVADHIAFLDRQHFAGDQRVFAVVPPCRSRRLIDAEEARRVAAPIMPATGPDPIIAALAPRLRDRHGAVRAHDGDLAGELRLAGEVSARDTG
jgi:hypothetical protein